MGLYRDITKLPAPFFYIQNRQKPSSEDLTKRADELNIGVKISKINLVPEEKLTPYLFYFVKFARYGRRA